MAIRDRKKENDERVITVDSAMQGSLSFKDPVHLRINGKFEGTLEVRGVLEIGEDAVVDATIAGDDVLIEGRVKGEVTASKRILLKDHAVVEGNIKTPLLNISEGAVFQGRCAMLGDIFDTETLARYLEVDLNTILEWANNGRIPAFKESNDWKFERKKIDEWVSAGKIG
ncbi:MAG: polymer-forming cytoskeletal protein [Candidatus Omnitrophica bacterium]|nr:polymer-forming cytoskeletal protein [Candidatus Omnitrophota bacterium]MDD5573958.1 polymer-forming cytoskeletal protein [Candidatus Omnitrophota bacterium]